MTPPKPSLDSTTPTPVSVSVKRTLDQSGEGEEEAASQSASEKLVASSSVEMAPAKEEGRATMAADSVVIAQGLEAKVEAVDTPAASPNKRARTDVAQTSAATVEAQ